jgi:hypothetical protein
MHLEKRLHLTKSIFDRLKLGYILCTKAHVYWENDCQAMINHWCFGGLKHILWNPNKWNCMAWYAA